MAITRKLAEQPAIKTRVARGLYRLQDRVPASLALRKAVPAPALAVPQPYGALLLKQLREGAERREQEDQQRLTVGAP